MIQQGLCREDGKGFLTNPSLLRHTEPRQEKASGRPFSWLRGWFFFVVVVVWLACSEANPFTVQNITGLYNLSPGDKNKMVIVRPASSVVFSLYLHKMALKDSCVSATSASWSIRLCSVEKTFALRIRRALKHAVFLLVNWSHMSALSSLHSVCLDFSVIPWLMALYYLVAHCFHR